VNMVRRTVEEVEVVLSLLSFVGVPS